mgnify:FL=1
MNILIAGDFAPMARLAKMMEEKRFTEVFPKGLRDVIKSADCSFVNFESPVVDEGCKPIPKCGPNLKCSAEAAEAVRYAGFTGVTLANNHILDYGADGLRRTVECCRNQGLDVAGVGDNLEDAGKVLYLNKDGETLAVINCCEHEFSIATDTVAGANPLNPVRQFYRIREAKVHADHVLVIVHGGHEHFRLPSLRMVETYRFFIDAGADAVVNHHQHCYSGYEVYDGKPIFYGLGNFCFDEESLRNCFWNQGYMVALDFSDEVVSFALYPYSQCNETASVELLHGEDLKEFEKELGALNHIICDQALLNERLRTYYEKCSEGELSILEPYGSRVTKKLYSLGFLPSFIKGRKLTSVLNHIGCESHRDKMLFCLDKQLSKK